VHSGNDCIHLHVASRDVEIVADAAADRHFAARGDEVAFDLAAVATCPPASMASPATASVRLSEPPAPK